MFKDAEYETDGFSMTVIWDSGKSSGTLTLEMSESFYRIERFIRRSSRKTEKPPEVTCETIPARKSKRDLYEEAYWKFVNSTTYDDAMYWKNQMEHHVDLALEPGGDNWVSWVKDPVVKEEIKKKHGYDPFYCISAFTLVCCTFILAQLLQLLGVI
jgi:hypothetical protein